MTASLQRVSEDKSTIDLSSGAKIFAQQTGDGDELIVFLHAVGSDHRSWAPQIRTFAKRYRCLAVDFRGHGKSSAPAGPTNEQVTISKFASDVLELIEKVGYFKAHLVGLSMGGVTALECYNQRPDMVQSLTLANTYAYTEDAQSRIDFMFNQLSNHSMRESAQELIPQIFAPETSKEIVQEGIEIEGSKNKDVYLSSWRSMLSVDFRALVPTIEVPVLLVGGSLDKLTPTEPLLTAIHKELATSHLVQIESAGHFSNLDKPAEFNAALTRHLTSSRAERPLRRLHDIEEKSFIQCDTVAQGLMRMLAQRGTDYFFSNSGTDFTPIIDALARYGDEPNFELKTIQIPHENTAIAMAHGYYLLTGRTQAVMAHVNVGTANMGLGIINASRSRIPMFIMAGKTPWYESDYEGCRTNFVQWGQDTFDQGAYFREFTKWDYELKGAHNLESIVDRGFAIAKSDPAGPVYLTLPKESLCAKLEGLEISVTSRLQPNSTPAPSSESIERATELIAAASKPLIITSEVGRSRGAIEVLVHLCQEAAIPIIEHGKRNFFNFPTEHPMHLGFSPSPHVEDADLIIVLESHVPWIPALAKMNKIPRIIQIGIDPLNKEIPMRSFPVDVSVAGHPALALTALREKLATLLPHDSETVTTRRRAVSDKHHMQHQRAYEAARADSDKKSITKRYLSYEIGQNIDDDVIIFNEYNLEPSLVPRRLSDSWFENSVASGLGWSLGAALGGQLANPNQVMMVTLGDGTYLFNTPLSAHVVAASYNLPILIVVFNDSAWSTIKNSYRGTTPGGWADKKNHFPLCDFNITVEFEKLAESCGGVGLRVETPGDLSRMLKEALRIVRTERKHVLLNVICERDA